MKKLVFSLLFIAILLPATAQESGIRFFHGSWDEAVALAKKEKKKNKPSRKKMAKPATVHVEPDIIMAGQQNECVGQSVDNKLNKKRKGEGRKHRKLSEEAPQKDALSTAQQPESGSTVRLKTPADARRAFIYSEIFNRKY